MTSAGEMQSRRASAPSDLDPTSFDRVSRLAYAEAGLMLSPAKTALVRSRIVRRMQVAGVGDIPAYLDLVESRGGRDEARNLIAALTTNVTSFFRERHHFDMLASDVLPRLVARAAAGERVRIWSAGCSRGPEPYSIAMEILRLDAGAGARDIRILASDISASVLDVGRAGIYPADVMQGVEAGDLRRFFEPQPNGSHRVRDEVRNLVRFRELNLIGDWPMRRSFDVIMCRNVVIYFDQDTQTRLWARLAGALAPDGTIFAGHSERIRDAAALGLESVGVTAYRCRSRGTVADPGTPGDPHRSLRQYHGA